MSAKIIKCWLSRHHWQLERELPVGYNNLEIWAYRCQVCGKLITEKVINLDRPLENTQLGAIKTPVNLNDVVKNAKKKSLGEVL